MLTTVHTPFDTRVFHKESKSLIKANHSVSLIAPYEKSYEDSVEGIDIITIKKPESKVMHPLTMIRVFIAGLNEDCDVYHCHEPGSLLVCSLLKFVKKKKLIYDIHEHYPGLIAENSFFPAFFRKVVYYLVHFEERVLSKYADYLITVDDVLKDKFEGLNPKIEVINNYPIIDLFTFTSGSNPKNTKKLIYVGGLTASRGIMESIMAFEKVLKIYPTSEFILVGGFLHPEYEEQVTRYCLEKNLDNNVIFTGYLSPDNIGKYMKKADVAISILQAKGRYEYGISAKFYEYLCAGKPMVINNYKYMSDLTKKLKSGIPVDPTNIQDVADAIIYLFDNSEVAQQMGLNGRRAAEEVYNWGKMEKKLWLIYENI
jgi:glycosyltransferase involved in cell wall biosynthesis